MNFIKKFSLLLVSSMLLFSLVACGEEASSGSEGNKGNDVDENSQNVEVSKEITDQFSALQEVAHNYLQNASFETYSAEDIYKWNIFGSEEDYIVVDVRGAEVFAKGHIDGAINIPYSTITNTASLDLLPKDKKIIVACFAGNQANHAAALWNQLGYDTATLENGMGGWTKNTDLAASIPTKTLEFELVKDVNELTETNDLPSLEYENVTNLEELLKAASQEYLDSGKSLLIQAPDLKEKIESNDKNIVVIDIRNAEDYKKGHIPTAYNIPVEELVSLENLVKLPTDKQIVLVGYNAYDSNQANHILNQLGYDSLGMASGMRLLHADSKVTGVTAISEEKLGEYPVRELLYEIGGAPAAVG